MFNRQLLKVVAKYKDEINGKAKLFNNSIILIFKFQ